MSLNVLDVRCRVTGHLRDAVDSPCCSAYEDCPIWRSEKARVWANKRIGRPSTMQSAEGAWL